MCRQLPEKNIFNAQHFLFFELHALQVMELRATNQFAYVNKHNFIASDMKIIKIKQQQIYNNTARIFIITAKFKSVNKRKSVKISTVTVHDIQPGDRRTRKSY